MEKEIKDLEEAVEKIQERLAELKEIGKAETPKRWRAEEGNTYYYIRHDGADNDTDNYTNFDNYNYNIGNYFKTEEQAEQKLEHLKIEQQLKDIALRLNNGKDMDWEEEGQFQVFRPWKYVLYYDFDYDNIEDDYFDTTKYQGFIYCLSKRFKDIAIAEIGEERLKNYLKEEV